VSGLVNHPGPDVAGIVPFLAIAVWVGISSLRRKSTRGGAGLPVGAGPRLCRLAHRQLAEQLAEQPAPQHARPHEPLQLGVAAVAALVTTPIESAQVTHGKDAQAL